MHIGENPQTEQCVATFCLTLAFLSSNGSQKRFEESLVPTISYLRQHLPHSTKERDLVKYRCQRGSGHEDRAIVLGLYIRVWAFYINITLFWFVSLFKMISLNLENFHSFQFHVTLTLCFIWKAFNIEFISYSLVLYLIRTLDLFLCTFLCFS